MSAQPATESPAHLVARLRFRHLKLLVELNEGGSLRAAASALNLTQPALSKALNEIESAFGFALFTRSARGLQATPRGEIAIRGAARLLQEIAHVHTEACSTPPATLLRLGAPPFVAQNYLSDVLLRLTQPPTSVRVHLLEERVPLLIDALVEGRVDALITTYPAELPENAGQTLRYENLFEADFALVAPATHALARASRVSWQQLNQERWIMPTRTAMLRRLIEDMFVQQGVGIPLPVIESTSPVTSLRLVTAGLGVSAVPCAALSSEPQAHTVRVLRVQPCLPKRPVALIYRRGLQADRIALLREALGLQAAASSATR